MHFIKILSMILKRQRQKNCSFTSITYRELLNGFRQEVAARLNPKDVFQTKLLGFVPAIIQLVYDLQFNLEKRAD